MHPTLILKDLRFSLLQFASQMDIVLCAEHTHTHTHNVCQKCFGFISYHWRARLLRDQYLITYTQMEENAILQVYNNTHTHTHTEELGNVTTVQRLAGPPSVAEGRKSTGDRGRCGHGGSQGSISIHKRQMNP